MAKMNYSNYQGSKVEKIPDSQVEVIPAAQIEAVPAAAKYGLDKSGSMGNLGQGLANGVSPAAAVCDLSKKLLDTVETLGKCVAAVSIEREKTAQIRSMYKAQIIESQEQTARIKIQEKEETRRLKINCENELKMKKLELEKFDRELKLKEKESVLSHEEIMKSIEVMQKFVDGIIDTKRYIYQMIMESGESGADMELQLHELHTADEILVALAGNLIQIRGNN